MDAPSASGALVIRELTPEDLPPPLPTDTREAPPAKRRIDATGLVIAPGFIDMLGQSEYWVLRDSRVASKVMQVITTELTG